MQWSKSALAQLSKWGISPEDAERAGWFYAPDASLVYPDFKPITAIAMPYFSPAGDLFTFERGGAHLPFCRVRYLGKDARKGVFGPVKELRYTQPKASGTQVYFPPVIPWAELLADSAEPLVITEGEAKALAGVLAEMPVIGLGGVYNFMAQAELLPVLDAIAWRGREVYICFDSDAATNPNILAAEARLVDELQRKRGARCYLVRLPQDGDEKVGIDDFLKAHGAAALRSLLGSAPSLGALDAKVVALNKSVAWIERENLVYDLEDKSFLPKDSFIAGSRFSALEHITVGGVQRTQPKRISVAKTWLTHPHAQRFSEVLFRPGEGATVQGESGRPALNLWSPWDVPEGDVAPFLELTEFLFSEMRPEDRALPLHLMIYKAQNPEKKIPLAIVLLGEQGCGKSLWGEIMLAAFAPYAVTCTSASLNSEFQGWVEKSLLALIDEAEGEDILKAADKLKSLISNLTRPMNEKFRPVRQVNSYTSYILTSNRRQVGAYSSDDRRMIVVNCPKKRSDVEFYRRLGQRDGWWWKGGGPKALLGWMLRYDLKGWAPPASAPMTAEKYLAYIESLTPVQALAEQMRTASEQTIKLWLDSATAWATAAQHGSDVRQAAAARATLDGVAHTQIRPWYTPEELAMMFPNMVETGMGSKYDRSTPAGAISRQLRDAGIPYLQCADDPRGFRWRGVVRQYLVVADFDDWRAPLRQVDFERLMKGWPEYGTLAARRRG